MCCNDIIEKNYELYLRKNYAIVRIVTYRYLSLPQDYHDLNCNYSIHITNTIIYNYRIIETLTFKIIPVPQLI